MNNRCFIKNLLNWDSFSLIVWFKVVFTKRLSYLLFCDNSGLIYVCDKQQKTSSHRFIDYLFLSIPEPQANDIRIRICQRDLSSIHITQIEMNISIQDLLLLSFNSAFNQNSNNGEQLFRRAVSN